MTERIVAGAPGGALNRAVEALRRARKTVALSGAGISVECGIPDFRSPGGLWERFRPEEYATIEAFLTDPDKAWDFYRALGRVLDGKRPGAGHLALAKLEAAGLLAGVITQNIDGLHTASGSRQVAEIHGEWRRLQCPRCGDLTPAGRRLLEPGPPPRCPKCRSVLKPNVVLFGEMVRDVDKAESLLEDCDCLLVVGTSVEVYPAAAYPLRIVGKGGSLLEFNLRPTSLTPRCRFLFQGPIGEALPAFAEEVLAG